ncbi:uncharacterized protein DNG_06764 [Cephalotrichum gorgonifer]|uniref:Transferase domain-containing protein n=1 Tax=Cephalotrichum gorgonifer TaxID=2041049 RepID=A0AAE8SWR9_9PEZI|nr:uncharacterized protein DNG_06764 [Cephalotrichum gorgonifer]
MPGHEKASVTPLSIWDQCTSRFHIRLLLCFEVENSQREQVASHLADTLGRLSSLRPDYAGRLHLGHRQGWVCLRESPDYEIPFDAHDITDEFGYTYQELKEASFPAKPFVHPRFGYEGAIESPESRVPVAAVRAWFIDGGMLLATFLHHAFGDGACLLEFLRAFAAQSRGVHVELSGDRSLEFVRGNTGHEKARSFDQVLKSCPEFVKTLLSMGPNQPTLRPGGRSQDAYCKDGRIFVFTAVAIQGLKDTVSRLAPGPRPPSSYVVLASLIWAHAARARLSTETHEASWGPADVATMTNPVNWRYRAFKEESKGYYGNSAVLAQTTFNTDDLLRACEDEVMWASLVRRVESCIRRVDEEYVRKRFELFDNADDPRALGLLMDPRVPQDLAFNTWREFGADEEWDLGVCVAHRENGVERNGDGGRRYVKPDQLRRSQDDWNIGGTLILPARKGSEDYEVLLTIPAPAMQLLCCDRGFLKWVDRMHE